MTCQAIIYESFGLYFVAESHVSSRLIRYFNKRLPRKVLVMDKN